MRLENVGRPQQQETTSSVEKMDDHLTEIEVEKTVLPGYAKHNGAAEGQTRRNTQSKTNSANSHCWD